MYASHIRAAKEWGLRPTATIMGDSSFGHRLRATGDVVGDPDGFTSWDYALIAALQIIQDYTDDNGLLVWERDSERVEVIADKKIDPFRAVIERVTKKKNYEPRPGEYFVPRLRLIGGEWPTLEEYVAEMQDD